MLWCLALMMSTACSDNKTENMEKEGVETVYTKTALIRLREF